MGTVLVTGGSGFVGRHVILQLPGAHHLVRTTVRALAREASVREMMMHAGVDAGDRLSFFEADLESDDGWAAAVAGCDYVMHVASPMPVAAPKTEDDLIVPARDGVLRVLIASIARKHPQRHEREGRASAGLGATTARRGDRCVRGEPGEVRGRRTEAS